MKTHTKISKLRAISLAAMTLVLISLTVIQPPLTKADSSKNFTLDVAEDCTTLAVNSANPLEDPTTNNAIGDTLYVGGAIFPGGTLQSGAQSNSPSDPGSIGRWRSRATLIANFNIQTGFDSSPIAFATMIYSLNNRDSLMSEGLVPDIGSSTDRAVIGGTGAFAGARGEVRLQNLGTNATGCFNYRFSFKLKDNQD